MTNKSVRWAFNFTKWNPTYSEMLHAISCVQTEEKERLGRFVFKKDLKSSLIGRLMMRKFVFENTDLNYEKIKFFRDDKGKPFLENSELFPNLQFNVSHQGNYAVLSGVDKPGIILGVDVMKLEYSGGKSLSDFFRLMTRNFSQSEWDTIKSCTGEKNQVAMFCRHWCLKESYVKAIGVGITVNLQDISFKINTRELSADALVKDTELFVRGEKLNWSFEEMLLDEEHCVASALNSLDSVESVVFKELTFEELMMGSKGVIGKDEEFVENYFRKLDK